MSFLRRMLDLLHAVPQQQTTIRLNTAFHSDLMWWRTFLLGVERSSSPRMHPAHGAVGHGMVSPGSSNNGTIGREISLSQRSYFPSSWHVTSWGKSWCERQVICHCDNQVVVACLRSRTSKVKGIMHLLRCLVFIEAHYNCSLCPAYITTKCNHLADDLSRNNSASFLSKVPGMNPHPSTVPQPLLTLLLDQQEDWTSPRWMHLFSDIFRTA